MTGQVEELAAEIKGWHTERHPKSRLEPETLRVAAWMIKQVIEGYTLRRAIKRDAGQHKAAAKLAKEYAKELNNA